MSKAAPQGVAGWFAVLIAVVGFALFATYLPVIADGETIRVAWDWVPSLGVALSFYLDGLSLLFALLITGVGAAVFLYSGTYMQGHPRLGRFYLYLVAFMLSMLGLVLADNLITLFVFWELTTVTSYLLIGFESHKAEARRSALQALLVTGLGGLAMLAGFLMIGAIGGTYELSELIAQGDAIAGHAMYAPILVLVLLGAFTKSAQFPFHFWLPNAMSAPTPVSAYLHSATMVKAGIYLMARMHPLLGGTEAWGLILASVGAVTAVWGALSALRQTDLKLMLAQTTVMGLGTLTMFLAADIQIALAAAVTFIVVHALYKAALFMVVGILDHEVGTREADALGGLGRLMPVTAIAAGAAAFSMAGFPPFLGFIGKELKYEGALAMTAGPGIVVVAAVVANALMVAVAGIVAVRPFWGGPFRAPRRPHRLPWRLGAAPLTLAALGLLFGVAPDLVGGTVVGPAVEAISDRTVSVTLKLWHGINLPLVLSILTFLLGIAVFARQKTVRGLLVRWRASAPMTGDRGYDATMDAVARFAVWQTRVLQGGSLRRYLQIVFAALAVSVGATLVLRDSAVWPAAWPSGPAYLWGVAAMIVAAAWMIVTTGSRLAAICALGVIGFGVALLFVMFGAPDLAMTQIMVETLTVIIVALVMIKLPGFKGAAHPGRIGRTRDAVISIAVGGLATALILAVVDAPLDLRITDYYAAESAVTAFGRNIVNVILVDFRALDTLGEIAVVAIAGFACYALIRLRAGTPGKEDR
ncbi:MAG: putative monovalent cation/H+ antiporter subunit A [Inquilinaceae bacterium]